MVSGFNKKTDNNSRLKNKNSAGGKNSGAKGKQKVVFASDPKQVVYAVVAIVIFIATAGVNWYKFYKYNHPDVASNSSQDAQNLSDQQKNSLESLAQGGTPQDSQAAGNAPADANDIYAQTLALQGKTPADMPNQAQQGSLEDGGLGDVDIMASSKPKGKLVMITVSDSGRSNPFMPAGESILPSSLPKFDLVNPPEGSYAGSEADNVMKTVVSGIMYDKYSPSAILNISGADYLVKRGDVINGYRVLAIGKTQVIVQLGRNVYTAGVGELLKLDQLNYNTIANLNKKFGGNSVQVNVKRKGY